MEQSKIAKRIELDYRGNLYLCFGIFGFKRVNIFNPSLRGLLIGVKESVNSMDRKLKKANKLNPGYEFGRIERCIYVSRRKENVG